MHPSTTPETTLGYNYTIPVALSDHELNQHCLIVGTTGSGKTTTILNFVDSALSRNLPCIYLDGKGSFEHIDELSTIAAKYNRVFKYLASETHHICVTRHLTTHLVGHTSSPSAPSDHLTVVGDIIKVMQLFIYLNYGELFDTYNHHNVINIKQSILNNELALFLFDAATYPEDIKKVAKMVINDIIK